MTKWAKLADGTLLKFPDGTADDVIAKTVQDQTKARSGGAPLATPEGVKTEKPWGVTDYATDIGGGASTGGVKLVTETAMLPATLARMAGDTEDTAQKLYAGQHPGEEVPWYRQPGSFSETLGLGEDPMKGVREAIFGGQDTARKFVNEHTYQPESVAGKLAEEGVQWVGPAAIPTRATRMMTGGARIGNYVTDVLTHGVLPWGVSRGTEKLSGSPELGALAGLFSALTMGAARTANTPEATVRNQTRGVTDPQWDAAATLQRGARDSPTPIDLSGAESIAQAAQDPKAPILKSLQVAEAHPSGAVVTAPFFQPRAGQVDAALESALQQIDPRSPQPQTIGPTVSRGAEGVVRDAERARSTATEPHYQAANNQLVGQPEMQAVLDDIDAAIARDTTGNISGPLRQFRDELIATRAQPGQAAQRPQGGAPGIHRFQPAVPATPEAPALDIQNLDTARKAWRDRLNASPTAKDAIPNIVRGQITPFLDRIDALMEANPDFARGKATHQQMTRDLVEPTTSGPVGDLMRAGTTEGVGNLLLPGAPTGGTLNALVDAVTRIRASGTQMLPAVRQQLEAVLSRVSKGTMGGERGSVGAKFARDVAGSPQLEEQLNAILGASGAPGAAVQNFGNLLEVLRATGKRLAEGSPTAQRNVQLSDLGQTPVTQLLEAASTGSLKPLFGDLLREYVLRGNVRRLAELTTGSVENMRGAAAKAWTSLLPEVAARTGLSAATQYQLGDRRQ